VDLSDASTNHSDGTRLLPDLRHGARTHDASRAEAESPELRDMTGRNFGAMTTGIGNLLAAPVG
jgi:hypothetical protein